MTRCLGTGASLVFGFFVMKREHNGLGAIDRIDSPARASTGARQRGSLDWSAAPRHKRSRESLRDMRASHLVLPTYEEGDEDDDEESVQIQDASDPEQEDEEDTLQVFLLRKLES